MRKASLTKTEQRFLWTAALVCAVCEQYGRFAAVEEAAAVPGLTEAVVEEWEGLAYVS